MPRIAATIDGVVRGARALYDRGAGTIRRVGFRLSRPLPANTPPVWSSRMIWNVVLSVYLTAFIAIFDPYFRPFSGPAPNLALAFMRDVTDTVKSVWYIVPAVIVIAIIGLMDWRALRTASRRTLLTAYGRAAYILAAIAIPGVTVNIVKQIVGRARPRIVEDVGIYAFSPFQLDHLYQSFPSGHATTAGSLAVLLMLWHPTLKWPLFSLMAMLACTRIPAGAHYPSDVVAGFSLGAIMALAMARWLARRRAVFVFDGEATFPRLIG